MADPSQSKQHDNERNKYTRKDVVGGELSREREMRITEGRDGDNKKNGCGILLTTKIVPFIRIEEKRLIATHSTAQIPAYILYGVWLSSPAHTATHRVKVAHSTHTKESE